MGRTLPVSCPPPPQRGGGTRTKRLFSIEVVTLLFGGGVEPGFNDPVTLIRGSSIRGHLRFWWRATRGTQFDSWKELREKENTIWGCTETPSPVSIRVTRIGKGQTGRWANFKKRQDGSYKSIPEPVRRELPYYVLFPFKGETGKRHIVKEPAEVTFSTSFSLTLEWPSDHDLGLEIEAAVWAWVNFGGLGSRTRRGCGALYCKELAPSSSEKLDQWYEDCLAKHGVQASCVSRAWPTLPQKIWTKGPLMPPYRAWSMSIDQMQQFRQGKGIGRNAKDRGVGRSRWPEADSIRRITHQGSPGHKETITTTFNAFPRSEFGLPIVFHFKDRGEPSNCTIIPGENKKRLASPIVLRPLMINQNNAVAMVLRLITPPLNFTCLTCVPDGRPAISHPFTAAAIRNRDCTTYPNSPLKGSPAGSALEAFMNFIRKEGFK